MVHKRLQRRPRRAHIGRLRRTELVLDLADLQWFCAVVAGKSQVINHFSEGVESVDVIDIVQERNVGKIQGIGAQRCIGRMPKVSWKVVLNDPVTQPVILTA